MMKTLFNKQSLFILCFFLLSSSLFSEESITFSANQLKGNTNEENQYTQLLGNAFIETSDMTIQANEIILSGKDFEDIIAKGAIKGVNKESNFDFACEELTYNRKTKIALLKNKVQLDDKENEVLAKAQIIEYNQNTEIAIMQIDVSITQKDNLCTSALAIYRKKTQMLEMSGNPKIKRGEDTFQAREITLNMETEEIYLDGKVKGSVVDTSKESNEQKEDTPPKE